jgi:two-component system sensor histidine kinase UhpB
MSPLDPAPDIELSLAELPVPTWVLDAAGARVLAMGPIAERVSGRRPEDVVGQPASGIVVPEEAGAFADWIRGGLARGMTGEAMDTSWRVRGTEGVMPAVHFALIPARWRGRPVVGLSAVVIPSPGELQSQYVETWHRYQQLVEALPLAVWTTDREMRFTWTAGSLVEFPPDRLLGVRVEDWLRGQPALEDALRCHRQALDGASCEFHAEWRGRTWHCEIAPLRDSKGAVVGAIGLCREVTQEREARRQVEDSRLRLRLLAHRLQSVREEEQKRISREIHDQIGGTISLLRVELARLAARIGSRRVEEREIVQRLLDTSSDLLAGVRRIAVEMRPPVLENVSEFGLAPLLESMAVEFARRAGLPIDLDVRIEPGAVDPSRAETAYHVVREALTNVVSHAKALHARVSARVEDGLLCLEVSDDGCGISPAVADSPRALGLLGIRERVVGLGGEVTIRGRAGAGTTLEARIPLHALAPADVS